MTLMWEAVANEASVDELVAYVATHADPSADVYRSSDARVVIIDPTGRGVPDAPAELMARPPHQWSFERVDRTG